MSHKPCEKFTWCDTHDTELDETTLHCKPLDFGIDLVFDEETGKTWVNWMPDWAEWQMKPGEIHSELRDSKPSSVVSTTTSTSSSRKSPPWR